MIVKQNERQTLIKCKGRFYSPNVFINTDSSNSIYISGALTEYYYNIEKPIIAIQIRKTCYKNCYFLREVGEIYLDKNDNNEYEFHINGINLMEKFRELERQEVELIIRTKNYC